MDEDTRNFLEHIFKSLEGKVSGVDGKISGLEASINDLDERHTAEFARVHARLDAVERTMGTLSHAVTRYGSHVELMLSSFAANHQMLDARVTGAIADLDRRVTALEQRMPPEAAA